jgi:hypothetical protein
LDQIFGLFSRAGDFNLQASMQVIVLNLLLAFVLGTVIAWSYSRTHTGMSYSRTFTQSLVLLTMIVCVVMLVVSNNIVTAFGLFGALALIRFRNVLKDTKDTVSLFLALIVGMAVGANQHLVAVMATLIICGTMFYLHFSNFGSLGNFDGHLSFLINSGDDQCDDFSGILHRFCANVKKVSVRHAEDLTDYVFQVKLRDINSQQVMLDELKKVPGLGSPVLIIRDRLTEM